MQRQMSNSLLAAASIAIAAAAASAAPVTPGDLLVYQVGTTGSTTALSSAASTVFLNEYSPTGTLVQTIAAPIADAGTTHAVTASGTASSEGQITLSPNGQLVAFTGYDAAPGTAAVVATTSAATPRVVGLLNVATGALDTSTALTDVSSANNIRSATTNGTNIYTAGTATGSSSGVHYATVGATTSTQLVAGNQRVVNIYNGQLYVGSGSGTTPATIGISSVGTGLPTAATTETNVIADTNTGASPYAFNFLNLGGTAGDTVYLADNGGSILKYSLVGTSYTQTGSAALVGVLGLSAVANGTSVTLYATTPTGIYSLTDAAGYNGTLTGTPTQIVTAGANTAFRGIVATAPASTPEPASLALLAGAGLLLKRRRA